MINSKTKKVLSLDDWDDLVQKTYGKIYDFQQQDGCQSRGTYYLTVPSTPNDFPNDTIPEEVNGDEMGVSFAAWLARDPTQKIVNQEYDFDLEMFWQRNFYPDIQMIANDLHSKGLLDSGEYIIDIDW